MRGRPSQLTVEIDDATRAILESWLCRQTIAAGLAMRARAMLLLADGRPYTHTAAQVGLAERHVRKWAKHFVAQGLDGLQDRPRTDPTGPATRFPSRRWRCTWSRSPVIACERPDDRDRSLCQWDCAEIARTLVAEGLVDGISDETVRRILRHHTLKPWRHHLWLSAKKPRDAAFAHQV